mmetsp:Transcript_40953/g.78211  ORF Transcript_40953/g.78211 Transcript_40953/m.78211 type:complete len:270 (+) Transcript_40953:500-1309(+)
MQGDLALVAELNFGGCQLFESGLHILISRDHNGVWLGLTLVRIHLHLLVILIPRSGAAPPLHKDPLVVVPARLLVLGQLLYLVVAQVEAGVRRPRVARRARANVEARRCRLQLHLDVPEGVRVGAQHGEVDHAALHLVPVGHVVLAVDLEHGRPVAVAEGGHGVVRVLRQRAHVPLHRLHASQLLVHPEAVLQRNDVQKRHRAVLELGGGLALQDVEVRVGGGNLHRPSAPKHLVENLDVLRSHDERTQPRGVPKHLVEGDGDKVGWEL